MDNSHLKLLKLGKLKKWICTKIIFEPEREEEDEDDEELWVY